MTTTDSAQSAADERIALLEAKLAEQQAFIDEMRSRSAAPVEPAVAPAPPKRTMMSLRELRKYDGELYVKHNDPHRQFSCHQALGEKRVDFDLGPAGRPDAMCMLPKLALEIRGIQRAWMRGTITISTDNEMQDEIEMMMAQHASYADETLAALRAPLQPSNNEKDIVTRPCLRCGRWGRDERGMPTLGIEGGQSMMTYADYKGGRPPLCEAHQHEEHLWVGSLVTNPQTGEQGWQFGSMVVGETQPGVPQQRPYQQGAPITPQAMQQYYQ